jgi:hypothetical protein
VGRHRAGHGAAALGIWKQLRSVPAPLINVALLERQQTHVRAQKDTWISETFMLHIGVQKSVVLPWPTQAVWFLWLTDP